MGFFDKAKQLYKLQKEAKQIQKELENIHIEAENDGIKVVISGKQEVKKVEIPDAMRTSSSLEKTLENTFNKALKKSQEIAAEKMKGIMGDLGLPGAA